LAENDNRTRLFPGLAKQLQELESQQTARIPDLGAIPEVKTEQKSEPKPEPKPEPKTEPKQAPADNVLDFKQAAKQQAPRNWSVEDIRRIPWRRILLIAVLVLLLAAVIILVIWGQTADLDALRRGYTYRGVDKNVRGLAYEVELTGEYASLGGMNRRTALASELGLEVLDEDGTVLASVVSTLADPILVTSDKLSLVYDAGDDTICLINSAMQTETIQTAHPILMADAAEGGGFCYLSATDADKSVLTVHSERFSEVFSWYSKTRYLTTAALSDNGQMVAAIGAGSKDGLYWSSLLLLRTDQETPAADVDLGEAVVLWVDWIGDTCVLVCRDQVLFYGESGALQGSYALGSRSVTGADAGDGWLALTLTEGRGRDTLLTLRTDGTVLGELALGREVEGISAAGDYAALLTPQGLSLYDPSLTLYAELADSADLRGCYARADGTVLLFTGEGTALYLP